MESGRQQAYETTTRRRRLAGLAFALVLAAAGALAVGSPAQDARSELDAKQSQLDAAQDKRGVLSTEIEQYSSEISQLEGEVAALRNREALVQAELDRVQADLDREHAHLEELRARLDRSVDVLEKRLVAIYKSDSPDMLTVILESDGYSDLLERYEYLNRIEEQDSDIVNRVRELRNETKDVVARIRAARDEIAAKKRELTRTRVSLESREAELEAARSSRQAAVSEIDDNIQKLEGDIGDLEGQIQSQLQSSTTTLPAGPIRNGSGSLIWPVNGPVTSPFGIRWGRLHAGIDIGVAAGTPIRAADSGTVALAAPTGGYGNYTCIDHGSGLSTCYAHQSRYATSTGDSVSQGEVIGYVGCTGSCFGDHLHFEVRVNGQPTDPMGYL